MKPEFLDLSVGTIVKCIRPIRFSDGTHHVAGQLYTVKADDVYYYRHPVNHDNYEIVKKG